jgi:hypothetical protein
MPQSSTLDIKSHKIVLYPDRVREFQIKMTQLVDLLIQTNLEIDHSMNFNINIDTPELLFAQHQDRICNILSRYNGPVDLVTLNEWIIEVSRTLCIERDSRFKAKFQTILRLEATGVLHDQIVNSINPENVPASHREAGIRPQVKANRVSTDRTKKRSARGLESGGPSPRPDSSRSEEGSGFVIDDSFGSPPPYTSTVTLQPIESLSEALPPHTQPRINLPPAPPKPNVNRAPTTDYHPPAYTPAVPRPTGDRFASLPPFPDPESNIVFAPGTFDDFTPEEIIDHYRPAITRMVFEAMGY